MDEYDLNYIYWLADKAHKQEDSNLRDYWLESLKDFIQIHAMNLNSHQDNHKNTIIPQG